MFPLPLMCVLSLILVSCVPQSDLGIPCQLQRKDPADPSGSRSIPLTEGELEAGLEYLSFGLAECEFSLCVRDANFVPAQAATDSSPAMGYCSSPCRTADSKACQQGAIDPAKFSCRVLIADPSSGGAEAYCARGEPH